MARKAWARKMKGGGRRGLELNSSTVKYFSYFQICSEFAWTSSKTWLETSIVLDLDEVGKGRVTRRWR